MLDITIHREMQIKTTVSYLLTPIRMTIIKKKNLKDNSVDEDVEELELFYTACRNVKWTATMRNRMVKKLKIERLYDSAISLLDIQPKESK